MTPRVFARRGDVRFLADPDAPTCIYAQERCQPPHESRKFWHSAGLLPVRDLMRAAEHRLPVLSMTVGGSSCWMGGHRVRLDGATVVALLVARDAWLERGGLRMSRPTSLPENTAGASTHRPLGETP